MKYNIKVDLNLVIQLFNNGKLKIVDIEKYAKDGYIFICNNGKITNIQPRFSDVVESFLEEVV